MVDFKATSRVYIDTNIFIYFIEAPPQYFEKVKSVFEQISEVDARVLTSEITVAECVYKPSQDKDQKLLRIYETLFEKSGEVELFPLDGALAKEAAIIGSQIGLKLIDAIHYVSALEAGCDVFVSNDSRFRSGPKMQVLLID